MRSTTPLDWGRPTAVRRKTLLDRLLGGSLHDGETLAVSAGEDGLVLGERAREKPGLATVH